MSHLKRHVRDNLVKQIVVAELEEITVDIMGRHTGSFRILSGLSHRILLDIHTVGGVGPDCFMAFNQHGSGAAEGIQHLRPFFHVFPGERRRQCGRRRTDTGGRDFLSV